MHHHVSGDYARALHAERLAAAAKRRPPVGGDLERLLAAAAAGQQPAWEALVRRFSPQLQRIARAHGLSRCEAEDAVQDTWIRLLRSIQHVREPRALGGWLATTARRESQRMRERGQREKPTAEALFADVADTTAVDAEAELGVAERREAVTRALQELPERHRALMLALFAETDESYGEIAARLGMPVGSIGPIRGRSIARLRRDKSLRQLAEAIDY